MTAVPRGRPQASSRETLAEAACELFLEQGYEATTIADITRRAGVSRSSFFNYFGGKPGAIWYALDERLDAFAAATPVGAGARELLIGSFAGAPLQTLALAIVNAEAMGVEHELGSGRALRQAALATALQRFDTGTESAIVAEVRAAATAAALFSAIWRWAARGAGSHRLDAEMRDALAETRASRAMSGGELRVAVIGAGAIGARVAAAIGAGEIRGAVLAGVLTRDARALPAGAPRSAVAYGPGDLDRAIDESDLIVECAGIAAATEYGPRIIASGRTLLLVSVGALADPGTRAALSAGPGVLRLTSGAIGGIDLLSAASRPGGIPGGIVRAGITSTKLASTLVQHWMSDAEARELRETGVPIELFSGSVGEAVERFPGSLNVACALAAATGLWDEVRVRLIADPDARATTHEIEAGGAAGEYRFVAANDPSEETPTSSAVVAEAVLAGISTIADPRGAFV